MKDYFSIGKIAASFGLTGEVVLQHALGKKTDLKGLETIFIEDVKDSFLPYFVEGSKTKSENEVYMKIEGINSKESTRRILKKEVWLLKEDFDRFAGQSSSIALLGFTMMQKDQVLGEVIEVIEQPMQLLCKIMLNNKEALIPIHEESLLKIDKKKKLLHVNLPEGLLEIYADA